MQITNTRKYKADMDYWKYKIARNYLEKLSLGLMDHEDKPDARVAFPRSNYRLYPIGGKLYYTGGTNVFNTIMDEDLGAATKNTPEKFGTGSAWDVIDAVNRHKEFYALEEFARFLGHEHFCYVFEFTDDEMNPKVLRIDLFRRLLKSPSGNDDFVGGIFHALRHFSMNGVNLSTGNDKSEVAHPTSVIALAIQAFFHHEFKQEAERKFISEIQLDDKYNLRFHFFYEENTSVHFINTAYKVKRKKCS